MGSPIKAIDGAARRRQRGFTYLMLLLWVAIAGVMLAALGTSWSLMAQREREAQWLWCGEQFRRALTSYAQAGASLQAQSSASLASPPPGMGFDLSNAALTASAPGSAGATGARAARRDGAAAPPDDATTDGRAAASGATASTASTTTAPAGTGPLELQDLLEDRRSGKLVRHLRQIYRDPLTGSYLWGLQRGPDGRITGIYSRSDAAPLRLSLGITHYRELVFGAMAASAPASSAASAADAASAPAAGEVTTPLRRRRGV